MSVRVATLDMLLSPTCRPRNQGVKEHSLTVTMARVVWSSRIDGRSTSSYLRAKLVEIVAAFGTKQESGSPCKLLYDSPSGDKRAMCLSLYTSTYAKLIV